MSFASRHDFRAARVKAAAWRRIRRIGDIPLQAMGIRSGGRRHQGSGVRVFRSGKKRLPDRHFYDFAKIHNRDDITGMFHRGRIMGKKYLKQLFLPP